MGTKQALLELQSRLAEKLQSAKSSGVSASWLAVEAGESRLLLPLTHAGEIFSWTRVHPVPYARSWFLGMVNLRGGLCGVVDLNAFITGVASKPRSEMALGQARLVALNPLLEVNCALLVDRLMGLRTAEAFVASAPAAASAPAYFGHVYRDPEGIEWQEINLQHLSQSTAFLGIGV